MEERFETFTTLIAKINRNVRRIKNQEMAEYDLRSAHISCLYYLYTVDGLTATDLCEKCEEDKATISRALEHLEKNGYLSRANVPSRRYKSPLILTDKGADVGRQIAKRIARVLAEVDESLSETERTMFYRSLKILSDRLDEIAVQSADPHSNYTEQESSHESY